MVDFSKNEKHQVTTMTTTMMTSLINDPLRNLSALFQLPLHPDQDRIRNPRKAARIVSESRLGKNS